MPKIVMTVGLPGCGKSTYAKTLEENGYVVCSSDRIREETGLTDSAQVFDELHKRAISSLKSGRDVVFHTTTRQAWWID